MLYEPTRFDALIDEPWVPARVEDAIGASVADAAAARAVELERATPDFAADEHYRPGALMSGETGALLVAFRLTRDPALTDDVHALVRGNVDNPTDDISWGAPGTLLAALAMGEWTGERRWDEAARESATALRERRG